MSQIINITSEALQATIRRLLPSQQGFGEDLQASNVIMPIIDLTPTAEGSEVRADLQTALAFGSQTPFQAAGTTVVIANAPGFYRIFAGIAALTPSGSEQNCLFSMSDGLSTKIIWSLDLSAVTTELVVSEKVDFTVFLGVGESISAQTTASNVQIRGSSRQIASPNGDLVNPNGFSPQ